MEKQFKKLGRQLRDQGVVPERDLWPGIEQAIAEKSPRRSFSLNAWFRLGAVAATLVLLVGSGYFSSGLPGPEREIRTAQLAENHRGVADGEPSLLQTLNHTIGDLEVAMAQDPENYKLSRLSLLAHRSRANLMRLGASR